MERLMMFQPLSFYLAYKKLENRAWDALLGVTTGGIEVARIEKDDSCHCSTINYRMVQRILDRLGLTENDVFVDVGSGKGRILCCAARHRCKAVVGIEYSEEFCASARANLERLNGRKSPVRVYNGIAEEYDYSEATVLFFFNPFGHVTLDTVLHRIEQDTRHQNLRIAFVNPSPVQDQTFASHDWLELYDRWDSWAEPSVTFHRRRTN